MAARRTWVDGGFHAVMLQATGVTFLTAFALRLGAGPGLIGLIAAIPLLARLSQLYASWRIERAGNWRRVALGAAVVGRGVPVLLLPLALVPDGALAPELRLLVLLGVLTVTGLGAAVFDVAWLTWMAELVPPSVRGAFFAGRNRVTGFTGLVAALVAALAVDRWRAARGAAGPTAPADDGTALAYGVLFAAGAVAGLAGLLWLRRVPDPRRTSSRADGPTLAQAIAGPLRDGAFRPMLGFAVAWGWGMGIAAPFFVVYMLQTLGLSLLGVTVTAAMMTLVTATVQRHYGRLADRFGTKTVLRAGTLLYVLTPLPWLVADPADGWAIWLPLVVLHVTSGVATAAVDLTMNPLVLKLAPADRRASYLASFNATYAAAQAVAPLAGGALVALLLARGVGPRTAFGALFVTAALLRAAAVPVLGLVHEREAASVGRMLRVVGRARTMRLAGRGRAPDASGGTLRAARARLVRRGARWLPLEPVLAVTYSHLARLAELVAAERVPADRALRPGVPELGHPAR